MDTNLLAKWRWLCVHGRGWLDRQSASIDLVSQERSLRRVLNAWQASMIVQQMRLARRAAARFPDANRWLWTERGLQQASDWKSAVFKASLIPPGETVADGCCGVGADLLAISQHRRAIGFDRDAIVAMIAQTNLRSHGREAEVVHGEFPAAVSHSCDWWLHVDPDRRAVDDRQLDRRTTQADRFSPSLAEILPLASRARGAIIKLAPATRIGADIELDFQRGWIGSAGECRQQLLVRGVQAIEPKCRFAVLCDEPYAPEIFQSRADSSSQTSLAPNVEQYVFDLHPVLHAAALQSAWANQHALLPVESPAGYFTGSAQFCSPWIQCFRVLDVLPWDERRVRSWLRGHGAGIVEVKKRLVDVDANLQQRRLSEPKGESFTLLITRHLRKTIAIVAQRVSTTL